MIRKYRCKPRTDPQTRYTIHGYVVVDVRQIRDIEFVEELDDAGRVVSDHIVMIMGYHQGEMGFHVSAREMDQIISDWKEATSE